MTEPTQTPAGGRTVVRRPGPAERNPRRHYLTRRAVEIVMAILGPVLFVALWQISVDVGWLDARRISSPWDVITSSTLRDAEVWRQTWITTKRMLTGFAIGTAAGLIVGIGMGVSRLLRATLESLLTALYTVPKIALLPVYLILFGFGESPRVYLIATVVFFFVWIYSMAAVMQVPAGYREAAESFDVSRWQMFRHVLLPGALPQIIVGLRVSAGVTVLMVISVELVLSSDGIGNLIERGRMLGIPDFTFVGIVISALLGVVFTFLVKVIGRRLTPWAKEDNAMSVM